MFSLITLPTNFTSDILGNASTIIADLGGYTTTIIGILLGVLVITFLIRILTH